jgi:hypothetical protein
MTRTAVAVLASGDRTARLRGHSLPRPLWPDLAARIALARRAEALRPAPGESGPGRQVPLGQG